MRSFDVTRKPFVLIGFLMLSLLPSVTVAQSSFDGTWKTDLTRIQFSQKPDVFLLRSGEYQCKTCFPLIDVKADGMDHKITGHPYFDAVNIKIEDDRTIMETDKKDGKIVATSKFTVSKDGSTAAVEFTDSNASNSGPVTGKMSMARVDNGPVGSHAISGSWRITAVDSVSSNALFTTYKVKGNTLHMSSTTGQSYTAKLDGTDASYKGDPGITSVSVKRIDKNTLEETDKRDGQAHTVIRMMTSADGKTMQVAVHDLTSDQTNRFTMVKQ
jgi:hypothetical protein